MAPLQPDIYIVPMFSQFVKGFTIATGFSFWALIQHKQKKAASGRTETAPCRAKQVRSGNASQSLFDGLGYFSLRRAYRNEAAGLIGGKA